MARRPWRRALAATVAVSALCGGAVAPVRAEGGFAAATTFVGLFATLCVDTGADAERIDTLASSMGLHAVAEGDPALAPPEPGHTVRAWRLTDAHGDAMILGLAGGTDRGRAVATCSLGAPAVAAGEAEDVLAARLALGRPFRVEPGERERITFWHVPGTSWATVVSATDRTPEGRSGVDFALTVAR